jgi:hypothetical protein
MSNTRTPSGTAPFDERAQPLAPPPAPPEAWQDETWHQSSWDLRTGLIVLEDDDITVPAELLDD